MALPRTLSVFISDGTFQAPINTPTGDAAGMIAADFNNDGKLDLAITTSTIANFAEPRQWHIRGQ